MIEPEQQGGSEERFVRACNRLAACAPGSLLLILDGIDRADAWTHRALKRIFSQEPRSLYLPIALLTRAEGPSESFREVVHAIASAELRRGTGSSPSKAHSLDGSRSSGIAPTRPGGRPEQPSREPPDRLDLSQLDRQALRVLRAASIVGTTFEAVLVASMLDLSTEEVLEALQRASDLGVPLADDANGHFEMPKEVVTELAASVLPSLRTRWHEVLAELLAAEELPRPSPPTPQTTPRKTAMGIEGTASISNAATEGKIAATKVPLPSSMGMRAHPGPDPLRSAGHLDDAGQRERAAQRRLEAVTMLIRAGDIERAGQQLETASSDIEKMPRTSFSGGLRARVKLERARLRWLGMGNQESSFSLDGALALACEARAELGTIAASNVRTDAAATIAGIAYDLGDGASLERASKVLSDTIASLLGEGSDIEASMLINDQAAVHLRMGHVTKAAELLTQSLGLLDRIVRESPSNTLAAIDLTETHHLISRLPLHFTDQTKKGAPAAKAQASAPDDKMHAMLTDIESAIKHALIAEAGYEAFHMRRELGRVAETLARLEAKRNNLQAAETAFARAMQLADESADLTGLARTTAGLAQLLVRTGTPRQALHMLSSSIELNREKKSPIGLAFDERILEEVARNIEMLGPEVDQNGDLRDELERARHRLVVALEATSL